MITFLPKLLPPAVPEDFSETKVWVSRDFIIGDFSPPLLMPYIEDLKPDINRNTKPH